jgi:hypothetical protein
VGTSRQTGGLFGGRKRVRKEHLNRKVKQVLFEGWHQWRGRI